MEAGALIVDLTPFIPEVLKYGAMGLFCAYLVYALNEAKKENAAIRAELSVVNEARLTDLKTGAAEMRAALATATEVIRAGHAIQDRTAQSASAIATAVESFQDAIERVENRVNEVANKIASMRATG